MLSDSNERAPKQPSCFSELIFALTTIHDKKDLTVVLNEAKGVSRRRFKSDYLLKKLKCSQPLAHRKIVHFHLTL